MVENFLNEVFANLNQIIAQDKDQKMAKTPSAQQWTNNHILIACNEYYKTTEYNERGTISLLEFIKISILPSC